MKKLQFPKYKLQTIIKFQIQFFRISIFVLCILLFILQSGEKDDFPDRLIISEDHDQTVNAYAQTAGGRHTVLHCQQEVLVDSSFFTVGHFVFRLLNEAFALIQRVI